MPLSKIEFQPGINKEATDYSAQGGWVDGNLVRFRKARAEKIGGWLQLGTTYYLGLGRAMHSWISLGGTRFLGVGTTWKYYVEEGNTYNDITPVRLITSAGDVTFAATNGSSTITITDTAHGAVTNDFVTFSGAATLGGLVTAAVLNQEYQITLVPNANTYTITAKDTSGDTVTANSSDSGSGGSSTVGTYQINVGLDTYVSSTGWGVNTWGAGGFGSASAISAVNQLRLWTNDNFGENLIINARGAGIYRWTENNGVSVEAKELSTISGANQVPTVALQVITSETDRHLVVLGSDGLDANGVRTGVIDPMLVSFSDAEFELEFEALATNSAGDVRLSSGSFIVGGIKSRQEILIWTDTSLYSMNFIGPPLTFAVNLVNEGAGLIGPKAAVNASNGVFFASKTGFYIYTGAVKKLPCSVQEYVFEDLDLGQAFKCHMGLNSEFSEMWFFYPSKEDNTGEISRYVIYNYEENTWSIGSLIRYSWLDAGIEDLPLSAAQESGQSLIFEHETGYNNNSAAMTNVFIESGDMAIGDGDNFSFVKQIIPDVAFISDGSASNTPVMNIVLKRRDYPGQSLTTDSTTQVTGTSTFSNVRSRARQLVFRFESDDDTAAADQLGYKWRLGSTRIAIQPSGRRA
jgi:hypothetical protein|tara:strand:+ start:867 stop:2768 length:1902 start_codon:yes stop_codon:yes gene_type:complete